MASIIRGTTPSIVFSYSDIDVGDITKAILTIKQKGEIIIEKNLEDATIDGINNTITWFLPQEDTLSLDGKLNAVIVCDWLLDTGVRGRSQVMTANVTEPGINEVISNE